MKILLLTALLVSGCAIVQDVNKAQLNTTYGKIYTLREQMELAVDPTIDARLQTECLNLVEEYNSATKWHQDEVYNDTNLPTSINTHICG